MRVFSRETNGGTETLRLVFADVPSGSEGGLRFVFTAERGSVEVRFPKLEIFEQPREHGIPRPEDDGDAEKRHVSSDAAAATCILALQSELPGCDWKVERTEAQGDYILVVLATSQSSRNGENRAMYYYRVSAKTGEIVSVGVKIKP